MHTLNKIASPTLIMQMLQYHLFRVNKVSIPSPRLKSPPWLLPSSPTIYQLQTLLLTWTFIQILHLGLTIPSIQLHYKEMWFPRSYRAPRSHIFPIASCLPETLPEVLSLSIKSVPFYEKNNGPGSVACCEWHRLTWVFSRLDGDLFIV